MKNFTFLVLFIFLCTPISAQTERLVQQDECLLDGMSFMYQYQSSAAIAISFSEGELTYQWIEGRNAGKPAKTYPYISRKLGDDMYYVNWHEADLGNFITLVFNFNTNTCASSVIVRYGSDAPITAFEGGIIEQVRRE